MKKYIELSPAELMLCEVGMVEYNEVIKGAEEQKTKRLNQIALSHPESETYKFEMKDNKLCMTYEVPDEKAPEEPQTSTPVKKVRKLKLVKE
jgi:hypothetical protein